MNPIILPPAMSKIEGQIGFFIFVEATSLGEGKLWIQTPSYPSQAEGLVNMDYLISARQSDFVIIHKKRKKCEDNRSSWPQAKTEENQKDT